MRVRDPVLLSVIAINQVVRRAGRLEKADWQVATTVNRHTCGESQAPVRS